MSRFIKIELSDDVYSMAARLAQSTGQTLEEWAAGRVSSAVPPATGNGAHANPLSPELAAFAGCVDIDESEWSRNALIDRDLAEEYGSSHEDGR